MAEQTSSKARKRLVTPGAWVEARAIVQAHRYRLALGLLLGGGYIRWLWGGYLDYCKEALHATVDLLNERGEDIRTNYFQTWDRVEIHEPDAL